LLGVAQEETTSVNENYKKMKNHCGFSFFLYKFADYNNYLRGNRFAVEEKTPETNTATPMPAD
jgi:hypothetical protein